MHTSFDRGGGGRSGVIKSESVIRSTFQIVGGRISINKLKIYNN